MRSFIIAVLALLLLIGAALAADDATDPALVNDTTLNETGGNGNTPDPRTMDADGDGVVDERDNCPETLASELLIDPGNDLRLFEDFAGCSCRQVNELLDYDEECVVILCNNALLNIKFRPYNGTAIACADEQFCEGTSLYGYPPTVLPTCVEGYLTNQECQPRLLAKNAAICTTSGTTTTSAGVNGSTTAATDHTVEPTTVADEDEEKQVPAANQNQETTDARRTYYLTGGDVSFTLPAGVREGVDQTLNVTFNFTSAGSSISLRDLNLYYKDQVLPLLNASCNDDNQTIICSATFSLPTNERGEKELSLRFTQVHPVDNVPTEQTIPINVKVAAKPFTTTTVPKPVIGYDDQFRRTQEFTEEERMVIGDVFDEMVAEDVAPAADRNAYAERVRLATQTMEMQKERVFDQERNTTTFTVSFEPPKRGVAYNVTIIEYIPKELAANADQIIFTVDPVQIINDDPLIMWHFSAVDERVDLSYEVTGDVEVTGNTIISTDAVETKGSLLHVIIPALLIPFFVILLVWVPRWIKK